MTFRPLCFVFAVLLGGCGDVGGSSGPTTPTLVAVAPQDFAGEVPCTNAAGAMRRYVATMFDLGTTDEPNAPITLPSGVVNSGNGYVPMSCLQATAFSFVIPGHLYDADIDAYDRDDLVAVGPGSRHLMDPAGNYVPPRWTTSCGRGTSGSPADGPVIAASYLTRFVRGCGPLQTDQPATDTAVTVSLKDALGDLACGDAVDQVNHFEVSLTNSAEPASTAACGEEVVFSDLTPDQNYFFDVAAFETDATEPRWQTSCFRSTLAGATLPAACDPLTEIPDTAAP
jgi:hypothetical protein